MVECSLTNGAMLRPWTSQTHSLYVYQIHFQLLPAGMAFLPQGEWKQTRLKTTENIHRRALHYVYQAFYSSYEHLLNWIGITLSRCSYGVWYLCYLLRYSKSLRVIEQHIFKICRKLIKGIVFDTKISWNVQRSPIPTEEVLDAVKVSKSLPERCRSCENFEDFKKIRESFEPLERRVV